MAFTIANIYASEPTRTVKCSSIKDAVKRLACFDSTKAQQISTTDGQATLDSANKSEKSRIEKESNLNEAKSLLKALKKIQSRTEVGITYPDYLPILSDTKLEFNSFKSSQASKEFPEFLSASTEAIEMYNIASAVWNNQIVRSNSPNPSDRVLLNYITSQEFANLIINKFPEIGHNAIEQNGFLTYTKVLNYLFSYASDYTNKASATLSK